MSTTNEEQQQLEQVNATSVVANPEDTQAAKDEAAAADLLTGSLPDNSRVAPWLNEAAADADADVNRDPEASARDIVTDALQKPMVDTAAEIKKQSAVKFIDAIRYGRKLEIDLSPENRKLCETYVNIAENLLGRLRANRYPELRTAVEERRAKLIYERITTGSLATEQLAALLQNEIDILVESTISFQVSDLQRFLFEGEMYDKKGGIYQTVIPNGRAIYEGDQELEKVLERRLVMMPFTTESSNKHIDYNAPFSYEVMDQRSPSYDPRFITKRSEKSVYKTLAEDGLWARLRSSSFGDEKDKKDSAIRSTLANMDLHSSMVKVYQAQADAKRLQMEQKKQQEKERQLAYAASKTAEAARLREEIPGLSANLAKAEAGLADLIAQRTKIETTDSSYLGLMEESRRARGEMEAAEAHSNALYRQIQALYGEERKEVSHPGGRNRIQTTKLTRDERVKRERPLMDERTSAYGRSLRAAGRSGDYQRRATEILGDLPAQIKAKEAEIQSIKTQIAAKEKAAAALEAEIQQVEEESKRAA